MMRPSGGRAGVGHRVISTNTMSAGAALRVSADGTCTSASSRLSNGTTYPSPDSSTSVPSDDGLVRTLEDPDDPALDALCAMPVFDACDDTVAVQGLGEVGSRNVQMRFVVTRVRNDESEPTRVCLEPADHDVHAIRQAEAIATDFDEVAAGNERLEMPAQRRPLLPRHPQHLQQFLDGRRMVGALADERQHLIAREHGQGCECTAAEIAWAARSAGVWASCRICAAKR